MLYAAYGSNLSPLRLAQRIPTAKFVGQARIDGLGLRFHKRSKDGSGKCNIVAADERVFVAIYILDDDERASLDRIEGVGLGYDVKTIVVPGYGDCYAYAAAETHIDDRLQPFGWYQALVMAGCIFHAFPQDYRRDIERIACSIDPDRARHDENMRLSRQARATPPPGTRGVETL